MCDSPGYFKTIYLGFKVHINICTSFVSVAFWGKQKTEGQVGGTC